VCMDEKIEEGEEGNTINAYRSFGGKTWEEETTLKIRGWKIILKWILKK
jgi:hypothetical protein